VLGSINTGGAVPIERAPVLTALAHGAVQVIQARLARGEPARAAIAEVLGTVFGADPELDRLVAAVLDIVGGTTVAPLRRR
jgi:hypothetical protein